MKPKLHYPKLAAISQEFRLTSEQGQRMENIMQEILDTEVKYSKTLWGFLKKYISNAYNQRT